VNDITFILLGEVAFYSYLSQAEANPGKHQTVIFDRDVTNLNGHYNHHAGIFISPENGIYTFTWSIYCQNGAGTCRITTELVVNSNPFGAQYCNGMAGQYAHISGNVVVQINKGDVVYVRTHPTNTIVGQIWSNFDAKSSLSGWKLL
jgi:hypothetical protein